MLALFPSSVTFPRRKVGKIRKQIRLQRHLLREETEQAMEKTQ
jgi:hypothetical protein